MKTLAAVIAVCAISWTLAGCLEIDLSRVNGNQKTDDVSDTEVTE
jgi:hypothetical protein